MTSIIELDHTILDLIISARSDAGIHIFRFFTRLADWQTIILASACILVWLVHVKKFRMALVFASALIIGEVISALSKILIHRARPDIALSLAPEIGYSLPSGHALLSMIFYGSIGYALLRRYKQTWIRTLISITTVTLIAAIGFSRVYLGVHWPSDVILGWLMGGIILTSAIKFTFAYLGKEL